MLVFYSTWKSPSTLTPGMALDHAQSAWWLRWFPYAIGNLRDPLLTDRIDVPDGVNLMWNTSVPLPAVVLAPVTLLAGPLVAYAALITVAPALNAWTAFLAIRRLVPGTAGPVTGGLLFGFSPFVLSQSLAHPHVTLIASAPLQLMALHSLLVRRAPPLRSGILLGLVSAAQLLISEEMLVIEVVAAAIALAVLAVLHRPAVRERLAPLMRGLVAATATCSVICAAPLAVQFLGPQHPAGNPQPADVYLTDAANLVLPTPVQAFAPAAAVNEYRTHIGGNYAEQDGYIGIPLLAVSVAAAVAWWRRPLVRWSVLSAAGVTLLALGAHLRIDGTSHPSIPMPWRPLQALPVLSQVLPARFMGLVFLFLALAVAVVVAELAVERRLALRAAWGAGLTATVVSFAPALPYAATEWVVPAYFSDGGAVRIPQDSVVLMAPFPNGVTVRTMLWQATAGMRFRMVGGFAYHPDAQGHFALDPDPSTTMAVMNDVENGGPATRSPDERGSILVEMRRWKVDSVVVGPDEHHDSVVRLFEEVLGRRADTVDGDVVAWYAVGRLLSAAPAP